MFAYICADKAEFTEYNFSLMISFTSSEIADVIELEISKHSWSRSGPGLYFSKELFLGALHIHFLSVDERILSVDISFL